MMQAVLAVSFPIVGAAIKKFTHVQVKFNVDFKLWESNIQGWGLSKEIWLLKFALPQHRVYQLHSRDVNHQRIKDLTNSQILNAEFDEWQDLMFFE